MGRKPVGQYEGVEVVGSTVRIRFTWPGASPARRCETIGCAPTPAGLAQASNLRTQVKQLIKLGVMTDDKYAELFPSSSYALTQRIPTFGEYAQTWLNSREIVESTRLNYRGTLNNYWMPHFATRRIDTISAVECRQVMADTDWTSALVRRNARDKMCTLMDSAVADGLIAKNPMAGIARPKTAKRTVDPFTRDEAERIIAWMYREFQGDLRVYACHFELAFFTGMRPGEQTALKWSEVDLAARRVHICRVQARGKIHDRVKTKKYRDVLLNDRALHALEEVKKLTGDRGGHVFMPAGSVDGDWIRSSSTTKEYLTRALSALGIRHRRQVDTRHTYATMCLMAGMNPAFIANQLGHSVQMLLSTYAKWLNSTSDWAELQKLDTLAAGTELVQPIS